ncbi:uncharacterized mitochondrial protein AtMg00860-like [Hevea brasiliensis]|uniref:uncharacterized mitochondrial protein AtMg00860-like n=1 Tax=Hevea brasiliensis TaxID=3981 RepID=UPI0025FFB3B2|nr:uncharacterized mitochondrial protein AtMg00860-like [Hevea brasiliensis]
MAGLQGRGLTTPTRIFIMTQQEANTSNTVVSSNLCIGSFDVDVLIDPGYIVSENGIEVDPKKVEAVADWMRLTTVIEIKSFLGLAGYYRRFVPNFSKIAALITRLTQKSKKSEWSDECEESFQKLKECLIFISVLALPRSNEDFIVYCDASIVGLGSVLIHNRKVIAYASR